MALTHNDIIKSKMTALVFVSPTAVNNITAEVLSGAGNEMRKNLGKTDYDTYVVNFNAMDESAFAQFDALRYNELTDAQKYLRNLFHAEAYFGLYILAIALKKLERGLGMSNQTKFGEGNQSAVDYMDLITSMDLFRSKAMDLLSTLDETDEDEDPFFGDGSMVVFAV